LSATSPLNSAVLQLETAERELVAQIASMTKNLDATRSAIALLRGSHQPGTSAPTARAPRPTRLPSVGGEGSAASARERAVLLAIAAGALATSLIRASIPPSPDSTDKQHRQSIQNALSRMKAKGLIRPIADGWALTAQGRKAAAAAAKEEP
jgi:hypothetical protein